MNAISSPIIHRSVLTALAVAVACAEPGGHRPGPPTTTTPTPEPPTVVIGAIAVDPLVAAHHATFEVQADPPAPLELACTAASDPDERHHGAGPPADPLTLYGLLASEAYDCVVTAGTASWQGRITTAAPDPLLPALTVAVDRGDSDGAYTLFNHWAAAGDGDRVLLVDPAGRPRWSWTVDEPVLPDLDARWLADRGVFLVGGGSGLNPRFVGLDGAITWTAPDLIGGWHHHHVEQLPDGDLAMLGTSRGTWNGVTFVGAQIQTLTPFADTVTWSWDGQSAIDAGTLPPSAIERDDAWHANALTFADDADGSAVFVSFKFLNRWVRIDRDTGAITWQLGFVGDFALQDPSGAPLGDAEWFFGQHDPEWDPRTSRLLVYDNGSSRPLGGLPYSRIAEYLLDIPARTATLTWTWTEPNWYEPYYGDADRLPSGHVLVAMGHCNCVEQVADHHSAIAEIDPENDEVVWRLETADPQDGLYRAERIDGCALFANAKYCPAIE